MFVNVTAGAQGARIIICVEVNTECNGGMRQCVVSEGSATACDARHDEKDGASAIASIQALITGAL